MSLLTSRINPYGGDLSHQIRLIDNDDQVKDITSLVVEFNIYESIFNQTLSAEFVVRDSVGIIDGQSPLTGQEYVLVTFDSSNSVILGAAPQLHFRVNKVGNKTEITPGTTLFTLSCASPELQENLTGEVRYGYKDKLGSEAVADIFNQYFNLGDSKPFDIETTENVVPYSPAGHTPFEAIETIGRESRSAMLGELGDASHYLFFETTQGFRFRTISSLLSQKPSEDAVYNFSDPGAPDNKIRERTIIGHTFLDTVDTIELLEKGMYDNHVSVIDPIAKIFSETRFNYATDFERLPHISGGGKPTLNLNKSRLLGDQITGPGQTRLLIGDLAGVSGNNATFDSRITPENDPYLFHGRERYRKTPLVAAQLASLRQHGIDITVPVNLTVNAGDIIQIFIPAAKDRRTELAFIEHYGANPTFLVVSINTKLTVNGDYLSTMQCVKESFAVDIRGQKILAGAGVPFTAGPLAYVAQLFSQYGLGTDNFIGIASGTLSSIIASGKDKALQAAKDVGTEAVDKLATDAAAEDAAGDATSDAAADAVPLEDAISDQLDATAADIEDNAKALADEAVQNLTNAAIATGTALVTAKALSALNVSPAKLAKLIQIIKILEKIPVFKGPITDVKADLAAAQDSVTSSVQQAGDSVSSAVTSGGE